ncbi:nucleoprotein TPR-like [Synchiropus picturatus]
MAVVLLQALERTELNKLSKGVQNKLEKFVTELQNANEALQTQHERFKADSEQQYFNIEKKLTESQEQTLTATRDLLSVKEENKKLNEELSALKGIEGDTTKDKPSQQQTKTKYEIEAENREVSRLLEKRTQEVDALTEDVNRLNEKLTDTSKVKMELQLKLDEIQSSEATVQHREKRVEQEKELMENKIEWLTKELNTKTEELLNTNREKGEEILELQGSLKSSKEQVTLLEKQLGSLRDSCESQSKIAEDLNNKLKQAKDEQAAMDEKYRNELNAHVKLSSLYKGAASDLETKNQELSRAVEELARVVKSSTEANKLLEQKVSETERQKTQLEAELREKLKKMEKELENSVLKASGKRCCGLSLTEDQLDSLCPSAAAIAAIVKPGMKFFDLYNAYTECQTQLQLEKQETRRVSKVLDEIVKEVESKAPVLKRQREEYESMQSSMTSICNKLDQARSEIYSLQKEKDDIKQRCETLEKEKMRVERILDDTSLQVCSLLVELEDSKGTKVTKDDESTASISSTSEGPQQQMFRSVDDLLKQNQSLRESLRQLEEEGDKRQNQETAARISELEASLSKALKEVEQLKEQRNQQKQLADSSARQRDMYKALLTQSTGFNLPTSGSDPSSQPLPGRPSVPATRSTPQRAVAAESAQTSQAKAALKQLNDAFTLYKKEKAENDKLLNETNDRLQKQLTEFRASHAKLTAQLEFSNKRYDMLQNSVTAFRREISALKDINQKMSATSQRHEHTILTMNQDLRQANEKLALEEVRVVNLTKERDMLRQAESRLNREKEALLVEQRNQKLLSTNLKTIQVTMERTETETRQRLNNKIEHLEAELTSMKMKLNQEVAQRHTLGRNMDAQLLEAKKQLETQNKLQQQTKEVLRSAEQQVTTLKAQLAATSSAETTTPATRAVGLKTPLRVPSTQASLSEKEVTDLKDKLQSAEEQNGELAEQLKNANTSVEQYRAVVLTLEDSLKKEKESRTPLESRLNEAETIQKQLENRIMEVEKQKQQGQEDKRKAVDAVEKQVSELHRTLKISQTELQEALERAATAVTQEQKATQESLLQTKYAVEAQAKYERELMLHAADVEVLQELKKRSQQESEKRRELEEQLSKTSSLLQERTTALNVAEKQLKDELSSHNRRCVELLKQNTLLHQQIDEMATQKRQEPQAQLDLSFSEEEKTTEQILEILRFVRREKEIALTERAASEGEALRYKQVVQHKDRELKEMQELLNAERDKLQCTVKTLAQQEEQLKKMESVQAVQEANKMLKNEREKLQQELQQAQAKVNKLQLDIAPLHNSLSQLSEKNGSLQADKRLLEVDLKHLKAKVQQLVSQQKSGDTEERQKLTAEREAQQKQIAQLAEEVAKLKTDHARSSASSNVAQSQLQGLRESVARLTSERDTLKKEIETKNNEILEKNKTITQVKKIGRRYKSQYEELKVEHDKVKQQEVAKPQQELSKVKEELNTLKENSQKKEEEVKKLQKELEEAQKENQNTKEKLQEIQNQQAQKQTQLTQVQSQLTQTQTQLQQNQNQLTQSQKELQQAKTSTQQVQNQLKSAQNQLQARQNQIQHIQKELQQAKDALQQNQKELQQTQQTGQLSLNQEINNLKNALSQSECKVTELQGLLDNQKKAVADREADVKRLQQQLQEATQAAEASRAETASQAAVSSDVNTGNDTNAAKELAKLRQELSETKDKEQQLTADKEKMRKVIVAAKAKISQLNAAKEQMSKEVDEVKQNKEEMEDRMNALKSQYEGRILRLERELRDVRDKQTEPKDETQDQMSDQAKSGDQRQISLKTPAQERGSSSLSETPTANIRPTPSTPAQSSKPTSSASSKATPRASIRPMVTPATVPTPTPTATVMPTTQADSQEVLMSGAASVHSSTSSLNTSLTQPSSTQATAFVQPTQQQAASQEAGSSMDAERPSASSSATGAAGSKRVREEEDTENRPESSTAASSSKKLRLRPVMELQIEAEDLEELRNEVIAEDLPDDTQELPDESFPDVEIEEEGVSQSVPSDQMSTQETALIRDVIVIDTDSESREADKNEGDNDDDDEDEEEEEEDDDEEEEDDNDGEENEESKEDGDDDQDDDAAGQMVLRGSEESRGAEGQEEEQSNGSNPEGAGSGTSSESPRPSEQAGETSRVIAPESDPLRDPLHFPPASSSAAPSPSTSSITPRLPQPRRPPHPLPPRLHIQPPAPELGPPHIQRQSSQLRRPSVGRGPQLTPGIGSMVSVLQQHFFDDDDRMVPSTPTLVVPHRTDGFAEAIHSPQVAGLSTRFRFGPPEDLLTQASSSHSDLGQLASQGGLGMYESPLFLAAHDEDGGGRSVPTTPLQVAAPVTVFTESLPSDSGDNMASQSVPMVTASSGMAAAGDDGDEVFMDQEGESSTTEASLEQSADMEAPVQQTDEASLSSTSQDPDSSVVTQRRLVSTFTSRGTRGGRGETRTLISRRGPFRGRGGMGRGSIH